MGGVKGGAKGTAGYSATAVAGGGVEEATETGLQTLLDVANELWRGNGGTAERRTDRRGVSTAVKSAPLLSELKI